MMIPMLLALTAPALQPVPSPVIEQSARRAWQRQRRGRGGHAAAATGTVAADQSLTYGADPAQQILFYRAPPPAPGERRRAPPLAVFIHGGGWAHGTPAMVASKPSWFREHGWAFASIGYRLLPGAPVGTQAADVGAALRQLRAEAVRLGYDPDRILLIGHSAGAHLAALVSSDPHYAGDAFGAIKGTILIDGACYDVPMQMRAAGRFMRERTYVPAFGTDPARQRALSPTTHAGGADVPDWLLLYTSAREDSAGQAQALATALDRNHVRTQLIEVPSDGRALQGHSAINIDFGTPGYAGNDAVLAIMRRVAGP